MNKPNTIGQLADRVETHRIDVIDRMRELDDEKVNELAESIKRQGLMQPIGVMAPVFGDDGEGRYRLIWGAHRLEAYKRAGVGKTAVGQYIPAVVYDNTTSTPWLEILEIEENLRRAELTADEKTEHTLRLAAALKQVESLSETENAPADEKPKPSTGRGHKGMIQKVAERTGVDQSGIRKRSARAEQVIGEPIDLNRDSAEDLNRKADQFRAAPKPAKRVNRQGYVVRDSSPAAGRAMKRKAMEDSAADHLRRVQADERDDPRTESAGLKALEQAWDAASPDERRRFLAQIKHVPGADMVAVEPAAPETIQETPEKPVEAPEQPVKADTDADAIRARLKESGLGGTRIAKLAGISQPAASRFLAGKTTPAPEKLAKLAALDI